MSRVLITGASGFIGSRIAIRAAQAGHEVIATTRYVTHGLETALNLPIQPLDVLDPTIATRDCAADVIVHCATANDTLSRNFAAGVELSVNGTRNILEMAVHNDIRNVLFFSTLQVYGTELQGTITESTIPRCESYYGLNHLMGEEVCRLYASKYGLNTTLLRPSNVYGVPDTLMAKRSTLVPMCFVKTALLTGRIVLQSSGLQKRNFISNDEVSDACLHLIGNPIQGAAVVNAASNWLASINELAIMVKQEYFRRKGTQIEIEYSSNVPSSGEDFFLKSRLDFLRSPPEDSHKKMAAVISNLWDYFASSSK